MNNSTFKDDQLLICKDVTYWFFFVFDNDFHSWTQLHRQVSRVILLFDKKTVKFSLLVNMRLTNAQCFALYVFEISQTISLTCIQYLPHSDKEILIIVPNLNITFSEMYRLTFNQWNTTLYIDYMYHNYFKI